MLSLVDVHFGTHINRIVLRPFKLIIHVLHSFQTNTPYKSYYVVSNCLFLSHLFGHITITLGFIISQIVVVFHLTPIQHALSSFIWNHIVGFCCCCSPHLKTHDQTPKNVLAHLKKLKRKGPYQNHLPIIIIKVQKENPQTSSQRVGWASSQNWLNPFFIHPLRSIKHYLTKSSRFTS